jgi:Domain of unknown function (DUF4253)
MHQTIHQILQTHSIDPTKAKPSAHPGVTNINIPGKSALPVWQSIRARFGETGIWPIFRGDANEEFEEYTQDVEETLANVPAGSVAELLAPRLAERVQFFSQLIPDLPPDIDAATLAKKVDASDTLSFGGARGPAEPWPTSAPAGEPSFHSIHNTRTSEPHLEVRLALIPLSHPHEAPAYLSFGGWNDAPNSELQVAMLREWNRTHGAVPIAITGDVLECLVARPPETEAEAVALAIEQWLFCEDIVSQGTQSVRNLGIEIWRSPNWFFWWD